MEAKYDIEFYKDKIIWMVRNSEMYYDAITEKVYLDKEYYYDEI